jgi:membrane-bound metal-dependent hydrolase YbcI (DUF457 family)
LEPFTHAFTSLALARAGDRGLPRFGTTMMIVSGLAPDLDYASYLGGPESFLRFHRTVLHSLAGAAALSCVIAGAFCLLDKKIPLSKIAQAKKRPPVTFPLALAACAVGAAGHLVLDLASGVGEQLLWPFHAHWSAWDLATNLDPWILILLIAGLLLPLLFRLVNEEVGDRRKGRGGSRAAIVTLCLAAAYLGAKANLHSRAIDLLLAREYHGRVALSAGAFPESLALFDWRGLVVTDNTIEEVEVPLGPGAEFDPNYSVTHYKPDDSAALEVGQESSATRRFLTYARFPIANVSRLEAGYRFEARDLRFPSDDTEPANIFVRVDLNSSLTIQHENFLYASSPNP